MSIDTDLRDEALDYLRHTTSKYSKALEQNPTTNWGKAFAALNKIGTTPVPVPDPVPVPPPVNPYQAFVGVCAYRPTDLDLIASLGVKHVRMDNPSAATIDLARSKGLEVLPIADYNPWTDTRPAGASSDKYLPDTDAKRQLWAQRMVAQWAGMASPPKVLEVWNEPWLTGFSEDGINAASYLALVKAFAAEAWKVWPGATILVASDTKGTGGWTGARTSWPPTPGSS
jgi:hypothetical protein